MADQIQSPANLSPSTDQVRLGFPTRVAYGFGALSEGIRDEVLGTFLLFYYTQVLGLSGVLTGVVLFLALIADAVTDPVVGSISDRLHTPLGRRHPLMYAAIIPTPLFLWLLFSPPAELESIGVFIWLITFTILFRSTLTLFSVPNMSLMVELTNDVDTRTSLAAVRQFFMRFGSISTALVGFMYFFASTSDGRDGRLDAASYTAFAVCAALMTFCALGISTAGTQRAAYRLRNVTY